MNILRFLHNLGLVRFNGGMVHDTVHFKAGVDAVHSDGWLSMQWDKKISMKRSLPSRSGCEPHIAASATEQARRAIHF